MMQTFDPISLILIMDDSTLLFYFDTSYYQTSIIKLNYWKPNIISTIQNTMISHPITVIVVVRNS